MGSTHRRNMSLESLFGPEILTKGGVEPTTTALAGKKHIMVYFSAHWCPPCRGYTPQLSEAYANSSKQDETAIVFVSSDQDKGAFNSYYGEMSFFALPYADRDKKTELSEKYGVRGIPTPERCLSSPCRMRTETRRPSSVKSMAFGVSLLWFSWTEMVTLWRATSAVTMRITCRW